MAIAVEKKFYFATKVDPLLSNNQIWPVTNQVYQNPIHFFGANQRVSRTKVETTIVVSNN